MVDRLADPLIGGIHAGNADELSAAATFPVLIAASHQSGSLMRRLGRPGPGHAAGRPAGRPAPVFWSLADTTASLVDDLAAALTARGVTFRTGTPVEAVDRRPDGPGAGPLAADPRLAGARHRGAGGTSTSTG